MEFVDNLTHFIRLLTVADLVDILLISVVVYKALKLIRHTNAEKLATLVSGVFKLKVIQFLLDQLMRMGPIAVVVIFQPELRKMLEQFGRSKLPFLHRPGAMGDEKTLQIAIMRIMEAVSSMAWSKTGVLLVFERGDNLDHIVKTGSTIDAEVNAELLKNIFYNKAPLHDGAVIISQGRIKAAGCLLPLSANLNISKELGTRHRAAVGMSENSDALCVVVSEETGSISLAEGGMLKRHLAVETLERLLINGLMPVDEEKTSSGNLFAKLRGKKK